MILDACMSILHFWLVFSIVAVLSIELSWCRAPMESGTVLRLARVDLMYGISAGLLIVVGFARAAHGPKGWAFYSGNPVFWIKIGLFVLVGLLSIVPTVTFIRWTRAARAGRAVDPAHVISVRKWLHAEAALLLLIPIAAALMARGIGY